MNNIVSYNTNSYHGFTVDETLEGIAAAGFKYVELCAVRGWTEHIMPDMSDEELDRVQKKMDDLGLKAVALGGHCNLTDNERLKDFEKNIELAHRFGMKYIISSTGEAHFGEEEGNPDDVLIANIKTLVPTLEKYDMTMALEIHGEYGTGESLYRLTRGVDSPYVGINYDTANVVFYGGLSPLDDIKTCIDDVKFVHLKDKIGWGNEWNLPAVGQGELPLKEFMDYMDAQGYEGIYSIEVEYDQEYCMRDKDQPGDLDRANQSAVDAYTYMKSIGRI